jgi:hypothetical protein
MLSTKVKKSPYRKFRRQELPKVGTKVADSAHNFGRIVEVLINKVETSNGFWNYTTNVYWCTVEWDRGHKSIVTSPYLYKVD